MVPHYGVWNKFRDGSEKIEVQIKRIIEESTDLIFFHVRNISLQMLYRFAYRRSASTRAILAVDQWIHQRLQRHYRRKKENAPLAPSPQRHNRALAQAHSVLLNSTRGHSSLLTPMLGSYARGSDALQGGFWSAM